MSWQIDNRMFTEQYAHTICKKDMDLVTKDLLKC